MNAVIETVGLTKYYGKARGIVDLNLTVGEGEIFGFIGPNGAGKSTTIRTLLSLIYKTSGEARIFGLDCERDKVKILQDVGYLPGEVFYYDNMRASDLFRYSASFYHKDCAAKTKELAELLQGIEEGEIVELFACGTAAVVTPIGRLVSDDFDVALPALEGESVAEAMLAQLTDIQYGRADDPHGWMRQVVDAPESRED